MKIHIVTEDHSDDTLCGEETCRHCPWGFLWLKDYMKDGFPVVDNMEPCDKCRGKVNHD